MSAAIISTLFYTKPSVFVDKGDGFYSTNEDSTTVRDEYLPLWVTEKPQQRAVSKIEVERGDANILKATIKHSYYRAKINSLGDSVIKVNTIYFPGWQVKADGQITPIDYKNKSGLITFGLSPGIHEVIINYASSPIHRLSEYISLAAFLVVGGYYLWIRKNSL